MTTNAGSRLFAAFLGGMSVLAVPSTAGAYVVQQTSSGKELHFTVLPQPFLINEDGSADTGAADAIAAVRSAFASWNAIDDSDAQFSDLSETALGTADVFKDDGFPARDRKNVLVWVESGWIEPQAQIAVTYTYYVETSGKILENDITMNGVDYAWTAGDAGVLTDVESIAAHEIGHAFGLGHSADSEATMFATSGQGETFKRSLSTDDQDAVVYLYPVGCCEADPADTSPGFFGCRVATVGGPSGRGAAGALGTLLVAAGIVAARSRRRPAAASGVTVAVAAIVAAMAARPADASVAKRLTLAELARGSEVVVRGVVLSAESVEREGGAILTVTTIEVADVLYGNPSSVVTVVEPGGEVNGIGLHVSGAARFVVGEEVVLFGERPKGPYATHFPGAVRPAAMSQGKFRVLRDSPVPRVARDLEGVTFLDGRRDDPLDGASLDEVERIVRSLP